VALSSPSKLPHHGEASLWFRHQVKRFSRWQSNRSHNSLLFEPLERALKLPNPLNYVVVGTGPGSYTGVRIGISAALGISLVKKVPVVGISSLCGLDDAPSDGIYPVIGDARRGSYFWAEVNHWKLVGDPEICSSDELVSRPKASTRPPLTCDRTELPVPAKITHPSAERLARTALHTLDPAQLSDSAPVEPIYLRAPYITTPKPKGRPKS